MVDWAKKARKYNPSLKEKYSRTGDAKEEKEALVSMPHFVTDPEGSIYAVKSLVPELFAALLKARYSRTELSAKQLLWREFVSKKTKIPWKKIEAGLKELDEVFNFEKAEGVAERILLQYGDDSVFELGGAHLFFDRISMVSTKIIEDARIGLSPLEKSTRYVVYDQKSNDGDYSFFKDPKIMDSEFKKLYLDTTRASFDLYAKTVAILLDHFRKLIPLEDQEFPDMSNKNKSTKFSKIKDEKSLKAAQVAYNASVRAKACDVARYLLPASTFTNVGEFGNARAYAYLLTKMMASPLSEIQMQAQEGTRELKKVLPKFFDVVDNPHGLAYQDYLQKTEEALEKKTNKILKGIKPDKTDRVVLVKLDPNPEVNIAAALLYPYTTLPLQQLIKIVKAGGKPLVKEIINESLRFRTNRRHKPPRAFEIAGYELVYDILGNFGIYRDVHRHRQLTQMRQRYTTDHGYDIPLEIGEVGLEKEYIDVMSLIQKANHKIRKEFPLESQYMTTMAHKVRWYMGMNLRQAFWLTELRSTPQGHFSYRTLAQDMFLKAKERYPFIEDLKEMNEHFVDFSDRSKNLERIEAMQKIQVKLSQIEDKE